MIKKIFIAACCLIAIKAHAQHTPADSIQHEKVEIAARFPGGDAAWRDYLAKNIDGNVPVKKKAPDSTYNVEVKFILSAKGEVEAVKAITSLGFGMEEEVARVIFKSPRWIPATQNGQPVTSYRRQAMIFVVMK